MLGIVGDSIDPRGLAYSSLSQYENVNILLLNRNKCLQSQHQKQVKQ